MHFRKNMTLEILEAETPLRALHRMRNDLLRMELAIGSSVFAAGLLPALQAWSAFAAGIPEGAFEAGIRRARRMMELMLDEALPDGLDPKARERLRLGRLAGGMLLGLLSAADDILQFEFKALENGRASDTSPAFDPSAELLLEFQIACAAKGRKAVAEALPAMRASKRIELERAGLCEFLLRRLIDRNIAALLREAREGGLEPALRHAAGGFPGADEEAVRFERILMKALSEECRKASFPALMPGGESSEASDAFFTRGSAELISRALLLAIREERFLVLTRENDGADIVEEKSKTDLPPRLWIAADGIFLEWPKGAAALEAILCGRFRLAEEENRQGLTEGLIKGLIAAGMVESEWKGGPREAALTQEDALVLGLRETSALLAALFSPRGDGAAAAEEAPKLSRLDWRLFPREARKGEGPGSAFVGAEGRKTPVFFWSIAIPDQVPLQIREALESAEKQLSRLRRSETRGARDGLFLGESFFAAGDFEAAADILSDLGLAVERQSALHGGALRRMRGIGPNAGKTEVGILPKQSIAVPCCLWSDGTVTEADWPDAAWEAADEETIEEP